MTKKKRSPEHEDGEVQDAATPPCEEMDALREEVSRLQQEKDEVFGKLQRISADYANFQKRVPKQISDSLAYEKETIIRSLLPVLDNLEHTLKAHSEESVDAVMRGVEIIYGQMLDVLKSHGVEQVHALGETFDPARHEAMLRREDPDQPENIILEEFQKGYIVNGRALRPSRVVVNKIPTEPTPEQQPEEPRERAAEDGANEGQAASE